MTFPLLYRTLFVAVAATLALLMAHQARAEGGEESVYAAIPSDPSPADMTAATDPAPALPAEEAPAKNLARGRAALEAKNVLAFRPIVDRVAQEQGLPAGLADAVVRIESRYNASARHGPYFGLMQINAKTAQALGYSGAPAGLLEPETNLRYGLKYLAMAYKLAGGDMCGTILRYQAGHRATVMTRAAKQYCARVKTIMAEAR